MRPDTHLLKSIRAWNLRLKIAGGANVVQRQLYEGQGNWLERFCCDRGSLGPPWQTVGQSPRAQKN